MKTYKELKESLEQLDELKKSTYANYIKAAQEDRETRLTGASFKSGKQGDSYNTADETKADENRAKGIDRALKKLTSEGVGGFGSHYSNSEKYAEIAGDHDDDYHKPRNSDSLHVFYHKVPFKDKNRAKQEGMSWDPTAKKWYHTSEKKSKASAFMRESIEELDEIKLSTVGKIIKHSPKIASAAIGAAVAAHSTEAPKQPVKASFSEFTKKVQKEETELDEVLDPSMGAGEYIKDFEDSDNPKFKGKSKEKRREMAIAAFLSAKRKNDK